MTRLSFIIGSHILIGKVLTLIILALITKSFQPLFEWVKQWPLILSFLTSIIGISVLRSNQLSHRGPKRFIYYYGFSFLTIVWSWGIFFLCAALLVITRDAFALKSFNTFLNFDYDILLMGGGVFLFYGIFHALIGAIILAYSLQNSKSATAHNNVYDS